MLTLEFFPDGKTLASGRGSRDKHIRLWDVETGNLIRTLTGHFDWILDIAVSPHGNILIACDGHYEIRLWNLNTGEMLNRIVDYIPTHRDPSSSVQMEKHSLQVDRNSHIYMWDTATAMNISTFTNTALNIRPFTTHKGVSSQSQVVFSPTENTMAAGVSGGSVQLL